MVLLVFAAILGGVLVAGFSPDATAVSVPADPWAAFASQHHCFLAVEDAYSTEKGTYIGTIPAVPPQGFKSIHAAVRFLRSKLPACTIWRDKLNGHIVHVVYTKALEWKANPLNQRLTFHGTMSMKQVAAQIIRKRFPLVGLICVGNRRSGFFPDTGGMAITKAYETPLRFDVSGIPLREFLTTGVVYDLKGPQPPVVLWRADYFLKSGKPTGRVDIMVYGVPLRRPPSTKPSALKK